MSLQSGGVGTPRPSPHSPRRGQARVFAQSRVPNCDMVSKPRHALLCLQRGDRAPSWRYAGRPSCGGIGASAVASGLSIRRRQARKAPYGSDATGQRRQLHRHQPCHARATARWVHVSACPLRCGWHPFISNDVWTRTSDFAKNVVAPCLFADLRRFHCRSEVRIQTSDSRSKGHRFTQSEQLMMVAP
jgi:hypothetical protein